MLGLIKVKCSEVFRRVTLLSLVVIDFRLGPLFYVPQYDSKYDPITEQYPDSERTLFMDVINVYRTDLSPLLTQAAMSALLHVHSHDLRKDVICLVPKQRRRSR